MVIFIKVLDNYLHLSSVLFTANHYPVYIEQSVWKAALGSFGDLSYSQNP